MTTLTSRLAVPADVPSLTELMDAAIAELQRAFLDDDQIASSRAITQCPRPRQEQQEVHETRVVTDEHRVVDLVRQRADPLEQRVRRRGVEGHLDPHLRISELAEHAP